MDRCIELCYELHNATAQRADSALPGRYTELLITSPNQECQRATGQTKNGDVSLRVTLCPDHGTTEGKIISILSSAVTRAEYTLAWNQARNLWQLSLDRAFTLLYEQAGEENSAALTDFRTALSSLADQREKLLSQVYADHPEIVAEMMNNLIKDCVIDACGEW